MRSMKPAARRRPLWQTLLLAVGAIVLGAAGTLGLLSAANVDLGKLAFWRPKPVLIPKDYVAVPVSARPIPAYTMVNRDYLIDLKTGEYALMWVKPEVAQEVLRKPSEIRGRVLKHEKPAAYAFTEKDFFPVGTKPGITAGIPLGKRAITLDAGKLKGCVHDLKEGDHFDLIASVPIDMPGAGGANSGRSAASIVASPATLVLPKRGFVKALVQDGVVVTPVKIRNVPTATGSLTQGMITRTLPTQEIVVAVAPEEVSPLAEAIDLKYELTCDARSGLPDATAQAASSPAPVVPATVVPADLPAKTPPAAVQMTGGASKSAKAEKPASPVAIAKPDITPGLNPVSDVRYLEVMVGKERHWLVFSGSGDSPVVAAVDDGLAHPSALTAPNNPANEKKE
jgi:hypothetical protein